MTCRAKYGAVRANNAESWPRDFLIAKILAKFDWVTSNGFMLKLYVMFYVKSVIHYWTVIIVISVSLTISTNVM